MKKKFVTAILAAAMTVAVAGLATSAHASGPGGTCKIKTLDRIWTDLTNGGTFSPLECYY